jgi:MinD superfamily P-loop ATPase
MTTAPANWNAPVSPPGRVIVHTHDGRSLRIAVASGKGGTGKTTIATSLALSLAEREGSGPRPLILDCDVEAPNAHLFLRPDWARQCDVSVLIPHVDQDICTGCGRCSEVCQYHALAVLGAKVLVFPQLCHGCGSCTRQCPEAAITEMPFIVGVLEAGPAKGGVTLARGVLNVGEPMPGPVIRQLKRWALPQDRQIVILDCPPGTSCPVVEAIRGADYVLLVTEQTPFGLHDLKLAAQVARELHIPAGVIVNRDDGKGYWPLESYCASEALPVLLRIRFDRRIAEGLARGESLIRICPDYATIFRGLVGDIVKDMEIRSVPVTEKAYTR